MDLIRYCMALTRKNIYDTIESAFIRITQYGFELLLKHSVFINALFGGHIGSLYITCD